MSLPVEHIVVGNYIWYSGDTSTFGWDCPAKIVRVRGGVFWVMSLDDMKEQGQGYSVDEKLASTDSRKSMRAIEPEEAYAYMRHHLLSARKSLADEKRDHISRVRDLEKTIERFLTELPDAT
jgi:hypothetical protein